MSDIDGLISNMSHNPEQIQILCNMHNISYSEYVSLIELYQLSFTTGTDLITSIYNDYNYQTTKNKISGGWPKALIKKASKKIKSEEKPKKKSKKFKLFSKKSKKTNDTKNEDDDTDKNNNNDESHNTNNITQPTQSAQPTQSVQPSQQMSNNQTNMQNNSEFQSLQLQIQQIKNQQQSHSLAYDKLTNDLTSKLYVSSLQNDVKTTEILNKIKKLDNVSTSINTKIDMLLNAIKKK